MRPWTRCPHISYSRYLGPHMGEVGRVTPPGGATVLMAVIRFVEKSRVMCLEQQLTPSTKFKF